MRTPKYIYLNPFFRLCFCKSYEKHIFVVGAPRSGTTLLANVIANHSNICSYNAETNLFSWRSCFLLFEGMAGRNSDEFNLLRVKCRNVVQLLDTLAEQCKAENECTKFLEKTPQHVFHLGFIISHFPNAKIVNVIRDPRDCYVSSKSNADVAQKSPRQFAKYWRRSIEARNKFANHPAIIDVRYERFVSHPSGELEQLMNWIGETYEPTQIDPELMRQDPRAATSQFRLLGKRISAASVGRWRDELLDREIRVIEEVVGGLQHMSI